MNESMIPSGLDISSLTGSESILVKCEKWHSIISPINQY